ncbi:MAG: DoxX family protein [Burkholderiaceae bacterium]|nr:DoxX family protein [Burkholderiaceae bacterium]
MNTTFQNSLTLLGRLALAALFLPAGLSKVSGFEGTVGYISSVGLPFASLAAVVAIVVEIGGGLALITGLFSRTASLILAAFTAVATVSFHAYWAVPAEQSFMQQLMFYKNVGVIGGLLVLAAHGPGSWTLSAKYHHTAA